MIVNNRYNTHRNNHHTKKVDFCNKINDDSSLNDSSIVYDNDSKRRKKSVHKTNHSSIKESEHSSPIVNVKHRRN